MTTQLSLYNNALLLIGERKLDSLTEAREARRVLDTVWEGGVVRECLEAGLWRFALRSQEITPSPSVTPAFGYQYGFDRPTDLVRTAAVCQDEYFQVPLLGYQTEGAYWFAEIDPIYVRYVSDDTSFGGDMSLWPSNFARYVEAVIADGAAMPLTQRMLDKGIVKAALATARSTDAMEDPTQFPPPGSWVQSRRGRDSGRDRGVRNRLIG